MLEDLTRSLAARPGEALVPEEAELRRAAVAAVLCPEGRLLFIKRSEREGDPWSGHMAFPGGRVDPTDASVQAAAVRETWEEVGLDLARHGRLVGRLDDQRSPQRRGPMSLVISPFVYRLDAEPPALAPNHEVADVHWFSLQRLASDEGRGTFEMDWRGQTWVMPRIDLDGVRVWGLTLRMVEDLLERVGVPPMAWPAPR
ncbi:MAG: CoA pyrophosphatase [Alphaproteobacteria bacterium]|nr:CoA pyrophosphatase [Alphaproteobacteria bacterium]